MRPEKKWVVGLKQFYSYEEARKFASANVSKELRDELITIIEDHTTSEGTLIEDAVDEILETYRVTRKKK